MSSLCSDLLSQTVSHLHNTHTHIRIHRRGHFFVRVGIYTPFTVLFVVLLHSQPISGSVYGLSHEHRRYYFHKSGACKISCRSQQCRCKLFESGRVYRRHELRKLLLNNLIRQWNMAYCFVLQRNDLEM